MEHKSNAKRLEKTNAPTDIERIKPRPHYYVFRVTIMHVKLCLRHTGV